MKHRALAWLLLILGFVFTRLDFFDDVLYNIDEAEYAVAADALDHGWLPGVDLVGTTKPPGIVLLFNLLFHVFGRSMVPIHAAHVVILILSGALVVELGVALWGLRAAIPAAALYWMAASSFNIPHETIALNVESPGMLCALLALVLVWRRPQGRTALLFGGAALGLAVLFRQSFLIFSLPLAAIVFLTEGPRIRRLAWLVAGGVLPWVPILVVYTARGALGWAWDSWVRYPITYSRDTGWLGFIQAFYLNASDFAIFSPIPLAMAVGGAVLLRRDPNRLRARFVLLLLIASVIALCFGSRFFGHYWFQLYPVLALLGASFWLSLRTAGSTSRILLATAVVVGGAMAAVHFPLWRGWDPYAPPKGVGFFHLGPEAAEVNVGEFARANTEPHETIAVWGYCPQIYYYAERLPGVRDYLCHYITGFSAGTFDPQSQRAVRPYGHPRAEQMFLEDLERRRPKYVFDLVQIDNYTFTFLNYSLLTYPVLADYLRQNYLPDGTVGRVLVYRRRTPADTWWPSSGDTP